MVYGREGSFDAERLIDMLEALEKFTAVRDKGDGTPLKVDGVRGSRVVGSAGDFRGSQVVDISDRETDVGDGRFRVSSNGALTAQYNLQQEEARRDEETVRDALRFFFSPEGRAFRDFMLEEVVTVVDASSRDALQELQRTLGLGNFPVPSLFRALNPELSAQDRKLVQQIGKLIQFLFGDFEGALDNGGDPRAPPSRAARIRQSNERLRKLVPVAREYAPQLREFGTLLVARLTEKSLSRGLNWATQRLAPVKR
jgi:aarF domain-containing kinase